jgi:hypothetical protein
MPPNQQKAPIKKKKKKNVPPAALPRKVLKSHFFVPPGQQQFEDPSQLVESNVPLPGFPERVVQRRFIFDKNTGEPYAEWINNEACCLETGQVLFRSRSYVDPNEPVEDQTEFNFFKCDFSVPTLRRTDDPTIYTEDLLRDGVITLDDFYANGAALTLEQYNALRSKGSN